MTAHDLAKKLLQGPDLPVCHFVMAEIDGSSSLEAIEVIYNAPSSLFGNILFWDDSKGDHRLEEEPVIVLSDRNV